MSGMVAGQIPIAATATSVTSSVATLAASFMPAHTGDVTSPAGSAVNTLATVNANVGTWNNVTLNAKGLATAGSNVAYVTGGPYLPMAGGSLSGPLTVGGVVASTGTQARSGTAGPAQANYVNIDWSSGAHLWIDGSNQGAIAFVCDYRIKENVAPLPSTWEQVKALKPISYTVKENEELMHKSNPEERWGFIAHELQDTLLTSAATGYKDAPNLVQSPDLVAVVAALTCALQEAMDRLETIEQRWK
jgi:hypothetical protein